MKKILKITILILIVTLVVLNGMSTIVKAEDGTFSLDETEVTIKLNATKYLSYHNKPTGETISWSSDNTDIATVDSNGTVKGVGIGTTTITAKVGTQSATCQVTVEYDSVKIGANQGNYVTNINLIMGVHESENLTVTVKDYQGEVVNNVSKKWSTSNQNIVAIDENGKITAKSVGKATITVEVEGASDTCEVTVLAEPNYTDFSNAKYELLYDVSVDLKISGTSSIDTERSSYYYIITPTNEKPEIKLTKLGGVDTSGTEIKTLNRNLEENYFFDLQLDEYVELNQDLYLWVIQDIRLKDSYYTEEEQNKSFDIRFLVEGEKLTRPELPKLNSILEYFDLGKWEISDQKRTTMNFRFPSATENRKFTIKIGRVTDNSILTKIKNNDYSGITELLTYAKNNASIFTTNLTTTSITRYHSKQTLFDGRQLLQDKAYYYIYVDFDDENGKYYPIEGVTLGQAIFREYTGSWWLSAYTDEDFEWNDLSGSYTDGTKIDTPLPNAGITRILRFATLALIGTSIIFKIKSGKYKKI